ncbi:MAG: hypothetical protein U0586_11255 [Candidatus Brocadiaceae bacterium]
MVHYTCDMCGKSLLAEEDIRYVVKIEVYAACDHDMDIEEDIMDMEEDDEDDEMQDEMEEASEILEDDEYKTFRFDLCSKCHKKYLQDPLFLKSWHPVRFSEN